MTVNTALFTVSVDVPVLAWYCESPAKLTPMECEPAVMGTPPSTRLTFAREATPAALVTAEPTTVPSREKVMLRPATAAPLSVLFRVVDRDVVPK